MAKRKRATVWIPLDVELASKLEARGGGLSSQVNEAVRNELTRPAQQTPSQN